VSSTTKLAIAIFAVLVVLLGVIYLVWLKPGPGAGDDVAGAGVASQPTPVPQPTPSLEERLSERLKGTTLATSDAVIRELAAELSSRPELTAWLVSEDLVRRFVASVNNIADGGSPRQHVEFLRPDRGFQVKESRDGLTIDAASYARYDVVAQVFDSLDSEGVVALYAELEPLIDDAYAEISQPGSRFDDRLDKAVEELLAVPVVETDIRVTKKVVTYTYADPNLEGLSQAQRQLLRMGPDNVRIIQAKLREIRSAL
jgi:hypothetical protein